MRHPKLVQKYPAHLASPLTLLRPINKKKKKAILDSNSGSNQNSAREPEAGTARHIAPDVRKHQKNTFYTLLLA